MVVWRGRGLKENQEIQSSDRQIENPPLHTRVFAPTTSQKTARVIPLNKISCKHLLKGFNVLLLLTLLLLLLLLLQNSSMGVEVLASSGSKKMPRVVGS